MLLRLIDSTLKLSVLFMLMLIPKLAFADVIYVKGGKYFGEIKEISETGVSISACSSTRTTAVKWDTIRVVVLTGTCTGINEGSSNWNGSLPTDCKEKFALFWITFNNGSSVLADSVIMGSDKKIRVEKHGGGAFSGPARSVFKIQRVKACSEVRELQNGKMPSEFKPQL